MTKAALAIALCVMLVPGTGRADSQKKKKKKADTSATEPQAPVNDVQRYLDAAQAFYDKLDFERALEQARRAEQFSRGPDDDVKISLIEGILLSNLQRDDEADAAFRKGLALKPDAKLPYEVSPKIQHKFESVHDEVTKVVGERQLPEFSAASTPDVPAATETSAQAAPTGTSYKPAWITGGGGILLLGSGTVLWLIAGSRYSALTNGTVSPSVALQYKSSGPVDQTLGWVFAVSGIGAIGTSAILFAVLGHSSDDAEARIIITRTGAGLGLSGVFP